ncbi:hypothetical protein GS440_19510 [Rhodococcus hoagii]|nr:hypothetical protein [Prescottella equi]
MSSPEQHRAPRRGELRIYLGAAPGVGKTYAMLGEAHRRLERGGDVVAAVVETTAATTSPPRSRRRCASPSIAYVLPTPGAAPR